MLHVTASCRNLPQGLAPTPAVNGATWACHCQQCCRVIHHGTITGIVESVGLHSQNLQRFRIFYVNGHDD